MKNLLLLLILAMPTLLSAQTPPIEPGVSQQLARWRAARYSDVRYKLNLTLEKMSPVLKGTIEIRVTVGAGTLLSPSPQGGESTPIILDWRRIKGFEDRSTISNVTLNGRAAAVASPQAAMGTGVSPLRELNEHLIFRDGVVAGENVIKLDFTSPILTSGSAITRYVDKEDGSEYIYSLFVPSDASTAFPVFDQPDLKARFELKVSRPSDWDVITNALGEDYETTSSDADKPREFFSSFVETRPISTYVFTFAAGPFTRFSVPAESNHAVRAELKEAYKKWLESDVSWRITSEDAERLRKENVERLSKGYNSDSRDFLHIYVRKSQAEKFKPHAVEVFRLNREAIKYFEQYFAYKFPFPKYDLVLIPEFPFGGMEHAGATFLRESAIIFPQEPTKNDHISRATLIFHEAAHQWFGDTVTMRWFDDLWLKEGFANFAAYKAMERIMPEMNAWKVFYERVKQAAYQTDSTKGTTAIYQPIANLSAAKSAYGAIVYNKAPAFLRQAEFYLGEDKFQTAVRTFLKKHEFGNAGWEDLVREFEAASGQELTNWAEGWVKVRGGPVIRPRIEYFTNAPERIRVEQYSSPSNGWQFKTQILCRDSNGKSQVSTIESKEAGTVFLPERNDSPLSFVFGNYQDYGYGIFLLDDKSRDYVLKNIQNERDPFLRSMMWGALWDSVREGELDPRESVELVVKVLSKSYAFTRETNAATNQRGITPEGVTPTEDESTVALLLSRVGTAMNYYVAKPGSEPPAVAGGSLDARLEGLLIEKMRSAATPGQRITYYRAFLSTASSENSRMMLKQMLSNANNPPATAGGSDPASIPLKTKDKFDIVTRLLILGDGDAPNLLADLEKSETSDDAKRYAYAAKAGIATAENKAKYWNDFTANKELSESWIEAAFGPWNAIRHSELTLPYLERALKELPNHKRNRKIFFVNGWLGAFIGGQRSEEALAIINKFLTDNPKLDNDLRLKILENADLIERAVRIRAKYRGD